MRLDLEAKASRVARKPQQPRRVVDEAPVVENPQPARVEVVERAGVPRSAPGGIAGEREGDRVDGEVAPAQVLRQRRGLHVGERARVRVRLATGARRCRSVNPSSVTVEVPNRSCTLRSAAERRGNGAASPSTTKSRSIGAPPRSRSRTAPPTRYTAGLSESRATSGRAGGSATTSRAGSARDSCHDVT